MAVTDCENAVRYPFRFGPALDLVKLKNLMANIFGKKEGESPFRSCDAALIFDGRSRKYNREVMKHLNAHIKFVAKENLPARKYEVFRMHYHNSSWACVTSKPLCTNTPVTSVVLCLLRGEFMDGGAVRKRATTANLQCPDHLESGICVMGKDFKSNLPVIPRKHFDVPSTSLDGFQRVCRTSEMCRCTEESEPRLQWLELESGASARYGRHPRQLGFWINGGAGSGLGWRAGGRQGPPGFPMGMARECVG